MIQNILDSISFTVKSCNSLLNKEETLKENAKELQKKLKEKENYLNFIKIAKDKYALAVNELYKESVENLSNTLNAALQYIFYDKNYKAKLILEDKRGVKSLSIMLVDEDDGLEVDLKDGVGNGVRTVISFVLKSYYLLNQNSKILLLDEKYGMLSPHYVPKFFEFIDKFCEENNFIIAMISHIDNQIEHADKVYYLNDGVITEEKEIECT